MTNAIRKSIGVLALAALLADVVSAQSNLIATNAGFEEGKKGWSAYGSDASRVNFTTEDAKSGKMSLKVESFEGTPTQLFSLPDVSPLKTEAGKKYKLSYWVKPIEKGWNLKFRVYEGSFKEETGVELEFPAKKMKIGEWQQVSATFEAKAMTKGKIAINASRGTYLIDDVELVEVK